MASRTGWEEGLELKDDLKLYVQRNLSQSEILDLMKVHYLMYAWSLRTLSRRLQHFGIKFINYAIDVEDVKRAVVKEMDGPGRLLGYHALHKKNLVYNVMADVSPKGLEERGGVGQPKRARRKTAFTSTVRILGQYKIWTVDYGLWTTDYGLGIKHGHRYKTRTKHHGLGIKYGIRYKTRTEHHGLGIKQLERFYIESESLARTCS